MSAKNRAQQVERKCRVHAEQGQQVLPDAAQNQVERIAGGVGQAEAPCCKLELTGITQQQAGRQGAGVPPQCKSHHQQRHAPVGRQT
ncbi:MAG: hypothetical protein R2873_31720 [Caldilineaceae bacterium]